MKELADAHRLGARKIQLIEPCSRLIRYLKSNFKWFGWKTPAALSFNWQYTKDAEEESPESYLDAIEEFGALLQVGLPR